MTGKHIKHAVGIAATAVLMAYATVAQAEQVVTVSAEPLPPLINEDGTGYTIDLLRAAEKVSDLRFEISLAPYSRAINNVKQGKADIVMHTPQGLETESFYADLMETEWFVPTATILAYKDGQAPQKLAEVAGGGSTKFSIGIPPGNEPFASSMLGVPESVFQTASLDTLVKMLEAGRIDAMWFEKTAVLSALDAQGSKGVNYEAYPPDVKVLASAGFRKNAEGQATMKMFDEAISKVDKQATIPAYFKNLNRPESGTLN